MEREYTVFNELLQQEWRKLNNEFDKLNEKAEFLNGHKQLLEKFDSLLVENDKLREENEALNEEIDKQKQRIEEMEMKMNEMSKLSTGMAKKASQNDFEKTLRTFLNYSKRKAMSKREVAKTVIMELLNSSKIEISDDVLDLLNHLDDEQPEPKVMNVQGNYNDVHDNGEVKIKD